jgi:hypothetical protein
MTESRRGGDLLVRSYRTGMRDVFPGGLFATEVFMRSPPGPLAS